MLQTNFNPHTLSCKMLKSETTFCIISIIVPRTIVDAVYQQAVIVQKKATSAFGFHKRETPGNYIEQNYQTNLVHHIQEFLLRYVVLRFLYQEIERQKLLLAGQPRIHSIMIEPGSDASFNFELSLFGPITLHEWKYLPFKAPKRKNYKDLDRQVESFLQDELIAKEQYINPMIRLGDWIHYTLTLLNNDNNPIMGQQVSHLWLRIGDEEPDKPFQEIFLKKKQGQIFISAHPILQEYFTEPLNGHYNFATEIIDVVPYAYFCVDQFKHFFKIKSNKEMYQKLIEVFSYRNDLSQRRTTVEEALKLLFSKHRFEIPNHLVLRQQKKVLDAIQSNPDYHVYRAQKNFSDTVRELAEKQSREELFLDQLAYEENISVSYDDISEYLNLTKRPRTKEFLSRDLPVSKLQGQEFPLSHEDLSVICKREKTINHIIYHLTKK